MATGAAVAAVVGAGIAIKGQRDAAKASARAARENAAQKRLQALELLDRFEINAQTTFLEGELLKGKQRTSFAAKGIEVGAEGALSTIEETNALVIRQIMLDRREAVFKAAQLEKGADVDLRLAGDIRRAQRLQSLGTAVGAGGQVAESGVFDKKEKKKKV